MIHLTRSALYHATLCTLLVSPCALAQRTSQSLDGFYGFRSGPAFASQQYHDGWVGYAATEWVSRYMERGRQRFESSGAFGVMVGGGYGPFGADLEQRIADSDSDREFRGNLRFTSHIDQFLVGARATYVSDLRGNPSYWDLAFGIGSELAWGIRWQSEIVYGTETDNFYLDAALSREWALGHEWSILASTGLGADLGYQRDSSNGFDHLVLGLDLARALGHSSTIFGGVRHFSPINRDTSRFADDRDLYDGFVVQFGARWNY